MEFDVQTTSNWSCQKQSEWPSRIHGGDTNKTNQPLHSFSSLFSIQVTKSGLSTTVEEGDYDGLVCVMHHLLAIKDRQLNTDGMFEPLKQTIELLKAYGQEMPDEVYQQLEVS